MKTIYMDHNATTPMRPEVLAAIQPYLGEKFGNPNSIHRYGRETRVAIENARDYAAALIGAVDSDEIFFTSGGTESDNWALRGVISAASGNKPYHHHGNRARGRTHDMPDAGSGRGRSHLCETESERTRFA